MTSNSIQAKILSGPMKDHQFEIKIKPSFFFSLKNFCTTDLFLGHMLSHDFLITLNPPSYGKTQYIYYPDKCELRFKKESLLIPVCYANQISDKVLKIIEKENA